MGTKVGIPRALFYYYYFPLWKCFFEALGAEIVVSPPTNRQIVDYGVQKAVDEACFPVKVFYGHIETLRNNVDYLFVPRLVSVQAKTYICPKFMGIPDMLRAGFDCLPQLIEPAVDLSKDPKQSLQQVLHVGYYFTDNRKDIQQAWSFSLRELRLFRDRVKNGLLPTEAMPGSDLKPMTNTNPSRLKLALLGHGYNLYDRHVSMDIIIKLRKMGVLVVTADNLPHKVVEGETSKLPKRVFWSLGKALLGGAFYFMKQPDIKGIIHLSSFGCGPDSLIGEIIDRNAKRFNHIPFMNITTDEHSGEAGLNTRLEAFVDMIMRRSA